MQQEMELESLRQQAAALTHLLSQVPPRSCVHKNVRVHRKR